MTDVSHELGALRFVVDSPLSSKVAMFNNQATQHKQSQLLNPFSHDGRAPSPKPTFSKDQYGKPLAGSLTEARGQKANMHVMKEMLELCQIIDSEGYQVKDEPTMRVIPFGELFNIYNYISDKVVGILLRARKHKLLDFEGEMLYQRRDDDVPIFLLRPIKEIRLELNDKIEEIKRGASPAPQSTSVMLDKAAHEQKLKVAAQRPSKSRTPSPAVKGKAKSPSPAATEKPVESSVPVAATPAAPTAPAAETAPVVPAPVNEAPTAPATDVATPAAPVSVTAASVSPAPVTAATESPAAAVAPVEQSPKADVPAVEITAAPAATAEQPVEPVNETQSTAVPPTQNVEKSDVSADISAVSTAVESEVAAVVPSQPIDGASNDLPTIVVEASATFVRTVSVDKVETETKPATETETVTDTKSAPAAETTAESA